MLQTRNIVYIDSLYICLFFRHNWFQPELHTNNHIWYVPLPMHLEDSICTSSNISVREIWSLSSILWFLLISLKLLLFTSFVAGMGCIHFLPLYFYVIVLCIVRWRPHFSLVFLYTIHHSIKVAYGVKILDNGTTINPWKNTSELIVMYLVILYIFYRVLWLVHSWGWQGNAAPFSHLEMITCAQS